jgi:hypothetical protein
MAAVKHVHVGKPPAEFPIEEDRVEVHFHDFKNLTTTKGAAVKSSNFTCAGHEWNVWLFPGGETGSGDGMISVYLGSDSPSKFIARFDIVCKDKNGCSFETCTSSEVEYPRPNYGCLGWKDFTSRHKILDPSNNVLNNGTLTFEVRIRPAKDYYCRDVIGAEPTLAGDIYRLFLDKDTADVSFKVKRRVFHAHKVILKVRAPDLGVLADSFDEKSPLPIKDVKPEIFEIMLKSVYGKIIHPSEWHEHSKDILDAAGKYGFTDLKSDAEAWHVKIAKEKFTVENVVDELLYADGKDCPLLKQAAMDFIVEHGEEVLDSDSYEKLDESPQLRKEVMRAAFSSGKRKRDD